MSEMRAVPLGEVFDLDFFLPAVVQPGDCDGFQDALAGGGGLGSRGLSARNGLSDSTVKAEARRLTPASTRGPVHEADVLTPAVCERGGAELELPLVHEAEAGGAFP